MSRWGLVGTWRLIRYWSYLITFDTCNLRHPMTLRHPVLVVDTCGLLPARTHSALTACAKGVSSKGVSSKVVSSKGLCSKGVSSKGVSFGHCSASTSSVHRCRHSLTVLNPLHRLRIKFSESNSIFSSSEKQMFANEKSLEVSGLYFGWTALKFAMLTGNGLWCSTVKIDYIYTFPIDVFGYIYGTFSIDTLCGRLDPRQCPLPPFSSDSRNEAIHESRSMKHHPYLSPMHESPTISMH